MTVRKYTSGDRDVLMPFFEDFYCSPALAHPLDKRTLDIIFDDAVNHTHGLSGFALTDKDKNAKNDKIIGFAHVSSYYATEVAGICVMIEDLYISPEFRGAGFAREFFDWLFQRYSNAKRFRLEVTPENKMAESLYKRLGFQKIAYNNMILDM